MITSKNYDGIKCKLIDNKGRDLIPGAWYKVHNGGMVTPIGGTAPHKSSSTGRVEVADEKQNSREYFPGVINAEWVPV